MRLIWILVLTVLMSACATQKHVKQGMVEIENAIDETPAVGELVNDNDADQIFAGGLYRVTKEEKLLASDVGLSWEKPVDLSMIAEYLVRSKNISLRIDPSIDKLPEDPIAKALGHEVKPGHVLIDYQGSLKGFLDSIAARLQLYWKLKGSELVFYQVESRTWALAIFQGKTESTVSINNKTGSTGDGGGSDSSSIQKNSLEIKEETLDLIGKTVESMMSARGKFAIAGGGITVTDQPPVLDRIDDYIQQTNARLSRQVVIDVDLYSVDVADEQNLGVNWQLVWESLDGRNAATTQLLGEQFVEGSTMSMAIIDPYYNYGGSTALVQALEKQGKVTKRTSLSVATLSNQPAPVLIATETGYLKELKTQLVADAGAQTTASGSSKTTGFAMSLYPIVLTDEDLILQYHLDLSDLRAIRVFDTGDNRLELPEVDMREFIQRTKLKSGQQMVMAGFAQNMFTSNQTGPGKSQLWFAGGSRALMSDATELVLVMTPRIMQ